MWTSLISGILLSQHIIYQAMGIRRIMARQDLAWKPWKRKGPCPAPNSRGLLGSQLSNSNRGSTFSTLTCSLSLNRIGIPKEDFWLSSVRRSPSAEVSSISKCIRTGTWSCKRWAGNPKIVPAHGVLSCTSHQIPCSRRRPWVSDLLLT